MSKPEYIKKVAEALKKFHGLKPEIDKSTLLNVFTHKTER